jgi:hypothetical protein
MVMAAIGRKWMHHCHCYFSVAARVSLPPSFRDGPKNQTSDVQLHIGESRDSGFASATRPGMTTWSAVGRRSRDRTDHPSSFSFSAACGAK